MEALGGAVDELVQDLYSDTIDGPSVVQEPEITSRICQRVEDRLDRKRLGNYVLRVTAQSMPDRGPRSLEKITGADLLLSVSLDGPGGFDKTLFVQTKYDRNVSREDLLDACRRMEGHVGKEGTYVWIYERDGVKVLSSHQVEQMRGNSLEGLSRRSMAGLTGRILDCYAGSRAWGIPASGNRRQIIHERLRRIQAKNSLDLHLKQRG
jgi:hypothetical protein